MYISCTGPIKYAFPPKMSLGSPGIKFEPILAAFGVPGGIKNEEKSVPGGGRKKRRFLRPLFFPTLANFKLSRGSKGRPPLPYFRSFFDPGG